jgi:uncharacterized Tic20 family protein
VQRSKESQKKLDVGGRNMENFQIALQIETIVRCSVAEGKDMGGEKEVANP